MADSTESQTNPPVPDSDTASESKTSRVESSSIAVANRVSIHKDASVAAGCVLKGDVTVGKGTVIHPRCLIEAKGGPIVIGEDNLIEEHTIITTSKENRKGVTIGSRNWLRCAVRITDSRVGDNSVLECRVTLHAQSSVGDGSYLSPGVQVKAGGAVGDGYVVWGEQGVTAPLKDGPERHWEELEPRLHTQRRLLQRYHKMKRTPRFTSVVGSES